MKSEKLSAIVEADETYFYESCKGQKKSLDRKYITRGYHSKKYFDEDSRLRGLSCEQVCVSTAVDRTKTFSTNR
jgi:hypothetical protein